MSDDAERLIRHKPSDNWRRLKDAFRRGFPVVVHQSREALTDDEAQDALDYLKERAYDVGARLRRGGWKVWAVYVNPTTTTKTKYTPRGPELANKWYTRRDLCASYRQALDNGKGLPPYLQDRLNLPLAGYRELEGDAEDHLKGNGFWDVETTGRGKILVKLRPEARLRSREVPNGWVLAEVMDHRDAGATAFLEWEERDP